MKILLDSKVLHGALTAVGVNASSISPSAPCFKIARFEVSLGVLTITSISEYGRLSYDLFVTQEGSFIFHIDHAHLRKILAMLQRQPITLEAHDTHVTLIHAHGRLKLQQPAGNELAEIRHYEHYPIPSDNCRIALDAGVWTSVVKNLKDHFSLDEHRPALCGMYLHSTEAGISAVATDAHTIAIQKLAHKPVAQSIILPRRAVSVIEKLIGRMQPDAYIDLRFFTNPEDKERTVVSISAEHFEYSFKIENTYRYPDYSAVIKSSNCEFTVNRLDFLASIGRVSSFFEDTVLDFLTAGKVTLYGERAKLEGVTIAETLDCEASEMPEALMFLNAFLKRTLRNITCEEVSFKGLSPTQAWSFEDEAMGLTYVVMPRMLDSGQLADKRREAI